MGERDDARHQVQQKRERMSRIAHEVSRRMTPEYAKERAREMARYRMIRVRDQAVESSWFAPLLGAGIGALVARAVQSRAQDRRYRGDSRWFDEDWERGRYGIEGYEDLGRGERFESSGSSGGDGRSDIAERARELKDRASSAASDVKERLTSKAGEMKEQLTERASHLRERLPDREQIRASTHDDAGIWALGALALGALFGFALPESEKEHELLEPARRKVREMGDQAKEMALEKGTEAMDKATQAVQQTGAPTKPGGDANPLH